MATKKQITVLAARLVEFQEVFLSLSTKNAKWAIINGKKTATLLVEAIDGHLREDNYSSILHLISGGHSLKLKASDGGRLICQAKDVFKGHIDPNFIKLGINKLGIATPEILVDVHEIVNDGTFMDIFQALPGSWDQKWISQDKVIDFCKSFPHWLGQGISFTFFLIKKDENKTINKEKPADNLAVVRVFVYSDDLYVIVFCLEDDRRWDGGHHYRGISPQLMPLST